jgi:hypothetical protein
MGVGDAVTPRRAMVKLWAALLRWLTAKVDVADVVIGVVVFWFLVVVYIL